MKGDVLMTKLDIVGQIADMKEIDYKNTLAIASIIEILIDKGVINRNDIALKAFQLENQTLDEIRDNRMASIKRNKQGWGNSILLNKFYIHYLTCFYYNDLKKSSKNSISKLSSSISYVLYLPLLSFTNIYLSPSVDNLTISPDVRKDDALTSFDVIITL